MCNWRNYVFIFVCLIALCRAAVAQGIVDKPSSPAQQTSVSVTASASGERVRITAPASVVQMHVEIYNELGEKLFDNELRGGNVFDWHSEDGQAAHLQAGDYLCVITTKNIAGKLTQKMGKVSIGDKTLTLGTQEISQLTPQQSQVIGPLEDNASWTVLAEQENQTTTLIAHDGNDGQVIRGRGALSFRLGNFFSGNDQEQMRLTEDGNLGIGTAQPQAKLDVAGTIRAEGVLLVKPKQLAGNAADTADSLQPLASGSGTQNRIAKWLDNAGALGDSVITELGGNIGINNSNPAAALQVNGNLFVNPVGATPTYEVLAGSDPTSTVMLTTNGSNFGWQIAPTNATNDTIVQVLGQNFSAAPNRGEFGIYLGANSASAFKVIQRGGPELFRVNRSGNVGIGDDFPDHKLSVLDSGNTGLRVNTNTLGGTVASFGGNGAFQIDKGAGPNSAGGRFTVLENGNVGIGTNAPGTPLNVVSQQNPALSLETTSNSFAETQYVAGNYTWRTGVGGSNVMNGAANKYYIYDINAGQFRMAIDTAGNVGIGTTSPEQRLHVNGQVLSTGPQAGFKFRDPDSGQDWTWHAHLQNGVTNASLSFGGSDYLSVQPVNGDPATGGDVSVHLNLFVDHLLGVGHLDGGGLTPLCRNFANLISDCSSSLRYKTNIAPFSTGLNFIRQLRPISFDWKQGGMHDVGFGAEDVAKINPLFVTYNKDGQVEGVKYDRLSTVFVNAFKEQQTQIEQQQDQIKKQRDSIKHQQLQIDALKKLVCADHPNAQVCKVP